jgi:co-chaperonin GroES (HSP10)
MPYSIFNTFEGDLNPIQDHVLVINMEKGDKVTKGGIITLDDNGKDRGIRPRWCQVWKVGHKNTDGLESGQWLLVEHGRWTYGFETTTDEGESLYIQRVDPKGILLVSDEPLYD